MGKLSTLSNQTAHEIMGRNFFGLEEAIRYFRIKPSREVLAAFASVPFSREVLRASKNTHVLTAVFPLSILDIRDRVENSLFNDVGNALYQEEAFVKNKSEAGWQLIRRVSVPESTSKTWYGQIHLLLPNEEMPTIQTLVYTIIGHHLVSGERLFENLRVRCSDLNSDDLRSFVGDFGAEGLTFGVYGDDESYDFLGLASARKW